jgi:hypothetical protein
MKQSGSHFSLSPHSSLTCLSVFAPNPTQIMSPSASGYLDVIVSGCSGGCNGHGFCQDPTGSDACVCEEGWSGYDCQVGACPEGPAWFDEALSATEAHQAAPCSNMGLCDKTTGRCSCAAGYSGDACQRMDCPVTAAGRCSHAITGLDWTGLDCMFCFVLVC